ncbi:19711_t:CDS:2 [Racocetra persica]|uniref:19711_t:CDS:1 n=1 Tax=Racocetra persica TaxID=160502 RepID=A0ACA9NIT9_9GLOM|nr:19711_t:CDS:2 [Racocetra persica]
MGDMAKELVNTTCPSENKIENDPSAFWDNGPHLDAHRIGWAVSGLCAFVATVVSLYLIIKHSQYYHRPEYQRHIIRIVLMVPIYAVISWLSYRFFHYSIYFETVRDCYEAFVLAAFFALLTQYVEDSPDESKEMLDKASKTKKKCPSPLCCYRYRPTSENFSNMVKWGILQYVALIPIITFTTLITEAFGVYCAESMSLVFAKVYLKTAQVISVTIAIYALVVFYEVIHDAIASERPFFKFLCVKLVVFFSFWQSLILSILASNDMVKDFIAVTIKVWDIARQRRIKRKASEKDRFSLHRALTSRRKQKYKNSNLETSSKNLDIEKSSKMLDSEA